MHIMVVDWLRDSVGIIFLFVVSLILLVFLLGSFLSMLLILGVSFG